MVESQVRGVEIWGIQFQSGICLIHSGASCGAGNLMLSRFLQETWMQLSVSGPSSASRSRPQGLRLLQCLPQWEGHVWWWWEPGCGVGSELSVRK